MLSNRLPTKRDCRIGHRVLASIQELSKVRIKCSQRDAKLKRRRGKLNKYSC